MSTAIIVLIVVVIAALAIVAGAVAMMSSKRRKLQERFGPEYDRIVAQSESRRLAEAELSERERRVKKLQLRELSSAAREQYQAQWARIQERFVDDPATAIAEGQQLVEAAMRDRGYPAAEYQQTLADLSVGHSAVLDHLRQAHEISEKAAAGQASTEDLRVAMLHYRELFSELLSSPADAPSDSVNAGRSVAASQSASADDADDTDFDDTEFQTRSEVIRPDVTTPDPVQVPHDDLVISDDEDHSLAEDTDEVDDVDERDSDPVGRARR